MRTPAAWLRSCKRRNPGVYIYRTRQHLRPWLTEWGYAGKSRFLDLRHQCHNGTCGVHQGCIEKPWFDLVVWRRTIRLPWWLGWDWITLSLETVVIWILRPRYNDQKNPRQDKVRQRQQRIERAVRDGNPTVYRARIARARIIDIAVRAIAFAAIIGGIGGYLWTK